MERDVIESVQLNLLPNWMTTMRKQIQLKIIRGFSGLIPANDNSMTVKNAAIQGLVQKSPV